MIRDKIPLKHPLLVIKVGKSRTLGEALSLVSAGIAR